MTRLSSTLLIALAVIGCGDGPSAVVAPPSDTTDTGPVPDPAAVAWLDARLRPLDGVDVRDDRSDLAYLDTLVGGARIVALGEATHGTSEFFRMKHRILDHLVRELGFRVFAMEASYPEMNRIDRWVRGGPGDPAEWLSGQYFWIWNTQEVLDLILWARAFNEGRPPADQVRVLGFDMQFAGKAIHDVPRFIEAIDTTAARETRDDLECYRIFANNERGRTGAADYGAVDDGYRTSCRASIDRVVQRLADHRVEWAAASSPAEFAEVERLARIIQQNEELARTTPAIRDEFMAENASWLLEQAGPAGRMVVWAHNLHVAAGPRWMGGFLRQDFGADYRPIALTFGSGSFHSRSSAEAPVEVFTVGSPRPDSYEFELDAARASRYLLDLRELDGANPATAFLRDVRRMRAWGTLFLGDQGTLMPLTDFDALVFLGSSTPTVLLPFVWPPAGFDG